MKFSTLTFLVLYVALSTAHADQFLYLSNKKQSSIDQFSIHPNTGDLKLVHRLSLKKSPGNLYLSNDQKSIYTNDAIFDIDSQGKLTLSKTDQPLLSGSGKFSKKGDFFATYNYGKNTISVVDLKSGKQADHITTTDHPHDVGFSNDGNLLFVPHNWDNRLYQYKFNHQSGKLTPLTPPYLTGPNLEQKGYANFRSLVFHPLKNVVYCTYEKGGGLASLTYGQNGLKIWQEFSSTHPGDLVAASRVAMTPNRKFLIMSNRTSRENKEGKGSLAVFKLDSETGKILNRVGIYENDAVRSREVEVDHAGKFLFSSSKTTQSTFVFYIQKDGSLKMHKEFKIGGGPMIILEPKT